MRIRETRAKPTVGGMGNPIAAAGELTQDIVRPIVPGAFLPGNWLRPATTSFVTHMPGH